MENTEGGRWTSQGKNMPSVDLYDQKHVILKLSSFFNLKEMGGGGWVFVSVFTFE
jgi:hypothetical protein